VSSFYFGSKTAAAAVPPPAVTPEPTPRPDPAPKPGPAITAVTPNSTPSGGATSIQISGVNLGGTKQVKLSQGAAVVDATDVKPSAGAVTCMVLLPSIGAWDVTLTDSAGHETKKVDAITAK
jgi:hypothetical protein